MKETCFGSNVIKNMLDICKISDKQKEMIALDTHINGYNHIRLIDFIPGIRETLPHTS